MTAIANAANVFLNQSSVTDVSSAVGAEVTLSLVISSTFAASSDGANQQESDLNALLSGNQIANMNIVSYELVNDGGKKNPPKYSNFLGIVISSIVVLTAVLTVVSIVVVRNVMYKRRKRRRRQEKRRLREAALENESRREIELTYLTE